MAFFKNIGDSLEDAAADAGKKIMMKKAENEIKDLFKKPGDDEEDKGDGGDNKVLSMVKDIASDILDGDDDKGSMAGNIISGALGGNKKEESGMDAVLNIGKSFF